MLIINTVLTLVSTGILVGFCFERKEFRREIRAMVRKEFDRIYDAECDTQYEIEHLKEKEKSI